MSFYFSTFHSSSFSLLILTIIHPLPFYLPIFLPFIHPLFFLFHFSLYLFYGPIQEMARASKKCWLNTWTTTRFLRPLSFFFFSFWLISIHPFSFSLHHSFFLTFSFGFFLSFFLSFFLLFSLDHSVFLAPMRSSRHTRVSGASERAEDWLMFFETLSFRAVEFSTFDFLAYLDFRFLTLTFDFLDFWLSSHRPHRRFWAYENLFHLFSVF